MSDKSNVALTVRKGSTFENMQCLKLYKLTRIRREIAAVLCKAVYRIVCRRPRENVYVSRAL